MIVDAHHHLWNLEREPLAWMRDVHEPIRRTFEPAELGAQLGRAGVSTTVLVQAACSDSDTDSMFEHASRTAWIGAVVAWVDLSSPQRAAARLDELAARPELRGIRHLIQNEDDPHWILRDDVLESLALLEQQGLILELPCVFPRHLGDVPALAAAFPALPIVIDHLGKPPLGTPELRRWAVELEAAAALPNVHAKISGLNTMLPPREWHAADLRPAVQVAFDAFGPDRLVCGSDWPVTLLNGDYDTLWRETVRVVELVAPACADALLSDTAVRLYRLDPVTAGATP